VSRVIELLEEATQSVPGAIEPDTDLPATTLWDSLSQVEFVTTVASLTGIELGAEDLEGVATPEQLVAAIERKAGS
jgi:acyl carrier protein